MTKPIVKSYINHHLKIKIDFVNLVGMKMYTKPYFNCKRSGSHVGIVSAGFILDHVTTPESWDSKRFVSGGLVKKIVTINSRKH